MTLEVACRPRAFAEGQCPPAGKILSYTGHSLYRQSEREAPTAQFVQAKCA